MNISRRGILTGAVASLFVPCIVRADSLMKLSGVKMDPWVLSYIREFCVPGENSVRKCRIESVFNFNGSFNPDGSLYRNPLSYIKKVESGEYQLHPIGSLSGLDYKIVRLSECEAQCYPNLR